MLQEIAGRSELGVWFCDTLKHHHDLPISPYYVTYIYRDNWIFLSQLVIPILSPKITIGRKITRIRCQVSYVLMRLPKRR